MNEVNELKNTKYGELDGMLATIVEAKSVPWGAGTKILLVGRIPGVQYQALLLPKQFASEVRA
jgi:hypothetical protein